MMKWIRPAGALSFIGIFIAIALFWFLLADWLLKTSIESVGTKAVGAQVQLDAADLTFSPLGFNLHNLQVTDPDQPMQNLLQVDTTVGNLELLPLLMGQIIIDRLTADGVRFNTQRTKSGAIDKPEKKSDQTTQESETAFDASKAQAKLPSVNEILERERLKTIELSKALQERIKTQRNEIKQNIDALPKEQKLKEYEKRTREISKSKIKTLDELQQRKKELDDLKNDIRADRQAFVDVRNQLRDTKKDLIAQYEQLKKAPKQDLASIQQRYGLNLTGAGNITNLLFGGAAQQWVNTIRGWAAQIQRMLPSDDHTPEPVAPSRGKGRFIHFPIANPLPDLLVRHAGLNMHIDAGHIEVAIENATHQPQILGKPLRLHAASEKLANAENIRLDGIIDHVNPAAAKDSLQWTLTDWKVSEVKLSQDKTLPLTLKKSRVNLSGEATLANKSLKAKMNAAFNDANWTSSAQQGWAGRVANTLATIKQFEVNAKLSGDLQSPSVNLSSDLDKMLKQAVAGQVNKAQMELSKKLESKLNEHIAHVAGPYKEELALLTKSEAGVDQKIGDLDNMLKAEMQSAVDTQKQEATEKLQDAIKGLKF